LPAVFEILGTTALKHTRSWPWHFRVMWRHRSCEWPFDSPVRHRLCYFLLTVIL